MSVVERKTYSGLFDRGSGLVIRDVEFRECAFVGGGLSLTLDPRSRAIVERVQLHACRVQGPLIGCAIFDCCHVEDIRASGVVQVWAPALRHVVIKGRFDRLMISDSVAPGRASASQQAAFDAANEQFYDGVDWALDIKEAVFVDCDLRGVPGRLVRRDSETQVLISREAALEGGWRQADLAGTHWATALELFLESGRPDIVLVAPKGDPNFRRLNEGLRELRNVGTAEKG